MANDNNKETLFGIERWLYSRCPGYDYIGPGRVLHADVLAIKWAERLDWRIPAIESLIVVKWFDEWEGDQAMSALDELSQSAHEVYAAVPEHLAWGITDDQLSSIYKRGYGLLAAHRGACWERVRAAARGQVAPNPAVKRKLWQCFGIKKKQESRAELSFTDIYRQQIDCVWNELGEAWKAFAKLSEKVVLLEDDFEKMPEDVQRDAAKGLAEFSLEIFLKLRVDTMGEVSPETSEAAGKIAKQLLHFGAGGMSMGSVTGKIPLPQKDEKKDGEETVN